MSTKPDHSSLHSVHSHMPVHYHHHLSLRHSFTPGSKTYLFHKSFPSYRLRYPPECLRGLFIYDRSYLLNSFSFYLLFVFVLYLVSFWLRAVV